MEDFSGLNEKLNNGKMHIALQLGNSLPPHVFHFFEYRPVHNTIHLVSLEVSTTLKKP